jgi:hypothetical protein
LISYAGEWTIAVTAARFQEQPSNLDQSLEDRLGDTYPHTQQSLNNLINLYEAWNKPKEAQKWRAKLPKTEAKIE